VFPATARICKPAQKLKVFCFFSSEKKTLNFFILPRHRNLLETLSNNLIGGAAFDLGAGVKNEAVTQHRKRKLFDIVGQNEIAAVQCGVGAGGGGEHVGGARGGADFE
jgi:hypothetical protein